MNLYFPGKSKLINLNCIIFDVLDLHEGLQHNGTNCLYHYVNCYNGNELFCFSKMIANVGYHQVLQICHFELCL